MTRDLQNRFNKYSNREVTIDRITLSHSQVQDHSLTPNPAKTADPRFEQYSSQYGNECWELDAIDPSELQRLVLDAITSHIDLSIWDRTLEEQREEREELEEQFSAIEHLLRQEGYF